MQLSKPQTLLCLLLLTFSAIGTNAQQVFKTTSTSVIGFLEYLPQDYNTNSNKYPIMIFLHGIGERGPNTTDIATLQSSITAVAKLGPPMYVKNGTQFPFILISPQLKDNYGTWPSSYVMEVLNYVKTYLRIDEKRIYITGLSLGGGGTWVAAQDYPELFAAVAPVCGGYNSPSKACGIAAENLPVWAFHGDEDTTVPLSRSVNMVNAINACTPTPNPLAKMTIYPGVGHSAWTNAYKTDNSIHNPNLYQWITSFTNTINAGNKIPTANAGTDQTISSTTLTITGSGTDADGTIASYTWSQLTGPSMATLTNATTKSVTASNLKAGTYDFRLTVKDNSGNTDSDYVRITMSANSLPVVNAGADRTITLPTNSVSITGTATDSDGTIKTYTWTKISGSSATLSGTTTATLSASAMTQGSYVFRLTATDDNGGSKSDDVTVTVNAATSTNILPVVNAGSDKVITLPTHSITLVSAASDKDGTIASYQWTKLSGSTCTLSNTTTAKLFVSGLITEGVYAFRLTVKDNAGGTASDDVLLTVNSATSTPTTTPTSTNIAPKVNAGLDKTITTKSLTVVGSATDQDGTIASYLWTKVSGPTLSMSNTTTPKLWASGMAIGTYVFRLTATDNQGATAYDEVKVTVTTATVSATSIEEDAIEYTTTMSQETLLADLTDTQLENSLVTIFDGSGARLYSGRWTRDSYSEVMSKRGLYIYNVIKDGKRTHAGKVFVQ